MASKKALAFLNSLGIALEHTATESSNAATGTGFGPNAMPYQVVRMDSRYGNSKQTLGWAVTLNDARQQRDALNDATYDADGNGRGGAEHLRVRRINHYIMDIRTNRTVA